MKKIVTLLLLLLFINIVIADEYNAQGVGDTVSFEKWNIKVEQVFENSTVIFAVWSNDSDIKTGVFPYGTPTDLKGVTINATDVFYDAREEHRLVWFTTSLIWKPECDVDEDCNDFNPCTTGQCKGEKRECTYYNITTCENNDGCCVGSCHWLSDNDCEEPCGRDSACNDKKESTRDYCGAGSCVNVLITACIDGDDFCPDGCLWNFSSGDNTDNDCSKYSDCVSHTDCDDNNESTVNICWGETLSTEGKYCQYILNESYNESVEATPEESGEADADVVSSANEVSDRGTGPSEEEETIERPRAIFIPTFEELPETNWKIIALLSTIAVIAYLFVALRIAKLKTPPKEKFLKRL